ncbi:hypothetical protein C0Q70_06056 [Pomacea canaliculata]|uniref:UBC core domain-containing protein n=1 Tax=Pomacea canaliculata TaxID=400727 RepID=A0A2T7PMY2_POMCA|nr:hypothetical protein C0Q70_06056 [Pomacea canaliculata]
MANRRLARDVQTLQRHVHAEFDGQVRITEVDDNLDYISLDVEPNSGPYQGARLNFRLFLKGYPEDVPQVVCLNRIYHPNIDPVMDGDENNGYIVSNSSRPTRGKVRGELTGYPNIRIRNYGKASLSHDGYTHLQILTRFVNSPQWLEKEDSNMCTEMENVWSDKEDSLHRPNRASATGYFLAGKDMHWFPVGASIFASNVGAPMFIGLAGTAAASGFAVAIYEWHAVYLCIALGWVFVPVYVSTFAYSSGSCRHVQAFTMPEYLKKRFGGRRLRIYLSVLALILYILTKISGEIYSGAIFMRQLPGLEPVPVCLCHSGSHWHLHHVVGFGEVGGWNSLMEQFKTAAANYTLADPVNYSCGMPREDFMHVWRTQ